MKPTLTALRAGMAPKTDPQPFAHWALESGFLVKDGKPTGIQPRDLFGQPQTAQQLIRQANAAHQLREALRATVAALEDIVDECEDATGGAVEDRAHDVWLGNIITECKAKLAQARAAIAAATRQ